MCDYCGSSVLFFMFEFLKLFKLMYKFFFFSLLSFLLYLELGGGGGGGCGTHATRVGNWVFLL